MRRVVIDNVPYEIVKDVEYTRLQELDAAITADRELTLLDPRGRVFLMIRYRDGSFALADRLGCNVYKRGQFKAEVANA